MPNPQDLNIDPNDPEAQAAEAAAFNAVADEGDAEQEPAGREQPPEEPPEGETPEGAGKQQPENPEPVAEPWKAELSALQEHSEKNIRQVYGKLGEVGHLLKQLQQSRNPTKVALPEDALKRVTEEFPELAKSLREDLQEVLNGGLVFESPATTPDFTEQFKTQRDQTLSEVDKRVEQRLLRRDHRDWEQVVQSEDFKGWVTNVLPQAQAAQLNDSWDADFISEKLTEFKSWKAAKQSQADKRKTRLEQAIAPSRGLSGRPVEDDSEEAAFIAGFNG